MKNATLFFTLVEIQLALLLISPIMAQDKSPRTLSKVDAELVCICGETFSPYAERVRLIHRLPSNLAPEQLERCRAFLGSPLAGQPLPDLEFNGLKNELVFALLQVCGTLGERGALSSARAIAGRNSAPVLRASAIAAIGMLGDASDLPLLERLAVSGDMRVSIRACSAIDRIMKTAEQPATPPI